ncbi:hypothetical protein [Streptosporangium sp. NPDC000396]|uniref:hypothetical protein n=1 Tax=Streptosporangium sp. NPDC000396 TaxID=3366185 RepID=UPI0036B96D56
MLDDRLEQFSRERLGGRPVPDDLRVLLTAQWEGRRGFFKRFGIMFLEPGEVDPLLDHSYLNERDRANPDIMANVAAFGQMTQYLKVVARHEDGGCYGYWVHPDEPADRPARIIQVDTEGSYRVLNGTTFTEACVAEYADDRDEMFADTAEEFAELGIPIIARSVADLHKPELLVNPDDVHEELYNTEREKQGMSRIP